MPPCRRSGWTTSPRRGPGPQGQAAMWSLKGSCSRPQRQPAAISGRGMRSRRRSSTRKSEELSDGKTRNPRARARARANAVSRHAATAWRSFFSLRNPSAERAAARICREAGATVAMNVQLRDLYVDAARRQDERRIEVIANGLAFWGGAQLAVDTTLVLPLTSAGPPSTCWRPHDWGCDPPCLQSRGANLPSVAIRPATSSTSLLWKLQTS